MRDFHRIEMQPFLPNLREHGGNESGSHFDETVSIWKHATVVLDRISSNNAIYLVLTMEAKLDEVYLISWLSSHPQEERGFLSNKS